MTITLLYRLTDTAMRTELSSGRPAHRDREINLTPTPRLASLATIDNAGVAVIDLRNYTGLKADGSRTSGFAYAHVYHYADRVLSAEDALDWIEEHEAAIAAKVAMLKAASAEHAATLAEDERTRAERVAQKRAETTPARELAARLAERFVRGDTEVIHVQSKKTHVPDSLKCGYETVVLTYDLDDGSSTIDHSTWIQIGVERRRRDEVVAANDIAERDSWIGQYGSARLRKCLCAGLIVNCLSIYRDERLALDLPGWRWDSDVYQDSDIYNPSEDALDALAEATALNPDAELLRQRIEGNNEESGSGWKTVVRMPCPFDMTRNIVRPVES